MTLAIGDQAPDFTLKDQDGNEVTLSAVLAESTVTVVFIPFAFTGTCTGELCELRDNFARFQQKGNQLLVITCDSKNSLRVWREQEGFTFPLLSDFWPHGEVARRYDAFNDALGCANRKTVVIGRDGRVVDMFESGGLGEARTAGSYDEALAKVG